MKNQKRQLPKGTLRAVTLENGKKIYIDQQTGRRVLLRRVAGKFEERIPNYVFGSFRRPAPSSYDKMLRPL